MKLKSRKEGRRDHRVPREENPQRVRAETSLLSVAEGGINENDKEGERERDIESLKGRRRERNRCHVMEIIPSTFQHYIPLSLELIFIFIVAEVAVLLTLT